MLLCKDKPLKSQIWHHFINKKWQHRKIPCRFKSGTTAVKLSGSADPYHWITNPDPDPALFSQKRRVRNSVSGKMFCRIHANCRRFAPPPTWNRQRRRCRITGIVVEAVGGAAAFTHHHPLGGGREGDRTLLDQLLHGVVRVEDVFLYELEGAGPVWQLVGEAVGQLGALQLSLFGAEWGIHVWPKVLNAPGNLSEWYRVMLSI